MKKLNDDKVFAALITSCPECGGIIELREIRRGSFEEMLCPGCGERFAPTKKKP